MLSTLPSRGTSVAFLVAPFVVFSAFGVHAFYLSDAAKSLGAAIESLSETGVLPTNNFHLRKSFSGFRSLDGLLRVLTAIFLPAAAGWDPSSQLQQAYFLMSIVALLAIWLVEAGRQNGMTRATSFVSIWPLFYQLLGGCVIVPLYYLFYLYESTHLNYFSPASRYIKPSYAKAILPAVILGYVLPTAALYVPLPVDSRLHFKQGLVAFWQFSPWYPNLLVLLFSRLFARSDLSGGPKQASSSKGDFVKPVRTLYMVLTVLCTIVHISTLFVCLTASNPALAPVPTVILRPLSSHKVPNALPSFFEAAHYVFQQDFIFIFAAGLVGEALAVRDLQTLGVVQRSWPQIALLAILGTVAIGPGATMLLMATFRLDAEAKKIKK